MRRGLPCGRCNAIPLVALGQSGATARAVGDADGTPLGGQGPPSVAAIEAVLLGTAYSDALGLPAEGMTPAALARRFGALDRFHLVGATGFVSDDTEQSALVAQSLARSGGDLDAAVADFRRAMLGWFARLPFGVGMATIRACVRIALGMRRTGVRSAGNGAAMRAAVLGVAIDDAATRRRWSDALATVTHVDPRAVEGARFVAELAARARLGTPAEAVEAAACVVDDASLREAIRRGLDAAANASEAPDPLTLLRREAIVAALGNTGFVVHTIALATFAFVRWGNTPLAAVRGVIALGGDTDSIGAIVGAWCGARHGAAWIPPDHLAALHDGPFGPTHLRALARAIADPTLPPPRYSAAAALFRNLALYPVILSHGLRRLFP